MRALATLASGTAGAAGLAFARTLLLAALLPPDEFGRAAALLVAISLVDLLAFSGLETRTIHHPRGDAPSVQAALQGAATARGVVAAGATLALAWPLAATMAMPEIAWGIATLAATALAQGATHLDVHRLRRDARFGRLALTTAGAAAIGLAATAPLALWLGDWRALLGARLVQAAAALAIGHLTAERPFRAAFDAAEWRATARFLAPVMLSGALVVLVLHGERVAVARYLTPETLGWFAVALTLTTAPAQIAISTIAGSCQPRLVRAAPDRWTAEAARTVRLFALAAAALAAGGALLGPTGVHALFGAAMAPAAALVGPLAAVAGLRLIRAGYVTVAFARGAPREDLIAVAPRLAALGLGAGALSAGAGLETLIWLAAAGEAAGAALAAARARGSLPPSSLVAPALAAIPIGAALILGGGAAASDGPVLAGAGLALVAALAVAALHRSRATGPGRGTERLPRGLARAS